MIHGRQRLEAEIAPAGGAQFGKTILELNSAAYDVFSQAASDADSHV